MDDLPHEILGIVFYQFEDFDELQTCACVCHLWCTLVNQQTKKLLIDRYSDNKNCISLFQPGLVFGKNVTDPAVFSKCFQHLRRLVDIPSLHLTMDYYPFTFFNRYEALPAPSLSILLPLTNLVALSIESVPNHYGEDPCTTLETLTKLHWLYLSSTDQSPLPGLPTNITHLSLDGDFSVAQTQVLHELSKVQKLKRLELNLENNQPSGEDIQRWMHFPLATSLEQLAVYDRSSPLPQSTFEQFMEINRSWTQLTSFSIEGIPRHGFEQLMTLTNVQYLHIGHTEEAPGSLPLHLLTRLTQLRKLVLTLQVTDVSKLFNLHLTQLEHLGLYNAPNLKDEDFSMLSHWTSLTSLDLDYVYTLTKEALNYLTALTNLTVYYLARYSKWGLDPHNTPKNVVASTTRFQPAPMTLELK